MSKLTNLRDANGHRHGSVMDDGLKGRGHKGIGGGNHPAKPAPHSKKAGGTGNEQTKSSRGLKMSKKAGMPTDGNHKTVVVNGNAKPNPGGTGKGAQKPCQSTHGTPCTSGHPK
jgi:hypothetical protein